MNGLRAVSLLCVMACMLHLCLVTPYVNHAYDDVSEMAKDDGSSSKLARQVHQYHIEAFQQSFRGPRMYLFSVGRFGVQISLVLTGFLVTFQLTDPAMDPGKQPRRVWMSGWFYFILRRLFRVAPLLLLVAPVVAFATRLGPPFQYGDPWLGLLRVLSFFSAKAPFARDVWLMPWTWTLSVQWTFYVLIFPIVALCARRDAPRRHDRLAHVLVLLMVLCIIFKKLTLWAAAQRLHGRQISLMDLDLEQRLLVEDVQFSVLGNLPSVLVGALMAVWVRDDTQTALVYWQYGSPPLLAATVALLAVLIDRRFGVFMGTLLNLPPEGASLMLGPVAEGIVAMLCALLIRELLAVYARDEKLLQDGQKTPWFTRQLYRALESNALQHVAHWSYASFLIHPVVAYGLFDLDFHHVALHYTWDELILRYVLLCLVVFPLAAVMHTFIEKPMLQMRGSVFPRPAASVRKPPSAAPSNDDKEEAALASGADEPRAQSGVTQRKKKKKQKNT